MSSFIRIFTMHFNFIKGVSDLETCMDYCQSCSIKNDISVISSKLQKCQCYYTLSDQSIPLVTVTSVVSLLTEQL